MVIRELKYVHIDYWSRPLFKDQFGNYFGALNKLFQDGSTFEDVTCQEDSQFVDKYDICYFGREIDGDPMGTPMKPETIKLVKEFSNE